MDTLISLLVFVAAFFGMVLVHELGHFLAARLCRIEVEEFGFGLPPRILTLFRHRGTEFTLNWLPLGGFVRPKGENDPSVPGGLAAAPPGARLVVLLAGVTMNLLTGFVLLSLLVYLQGRPTDRVQIVDMRPGLPADRAGVRVGDVVVALDGQPVSSIEQVHNYIYAHLDQPIRFTLEREGRILEIAVVPESAVISETQGPTGIFTGYVTVPYASWFAALPDAATASGRLIYELVTLPARVLRGELAGDQARLIGLKGIYDITSEAVASDLDSRAGASAPPAPTYYTLQLFMLLNFSLAVFNVLPLPALDGGRVLFVLTEIVLRRRVPHQVENAVHTIGMALLLALMLYVNIMDFVNPIDFSLP